MNKLEQKNLTLNRIYEQDNQELESILNYKRGTAYEIRKFINYLPDYDYEYNIRPIAQTILKIDLTITPRFKWHRHWHNRTERLWVMVDNEKEILHYENVGITSAHYKDPMVVSFFVPFRSGLRDKYYHLTITSDRWLGVDMYE